MSLIQIWFFALAIKLALLPFLPITPDEAYYFVWGRHLQLSYFDHPPFISWIMYLAQPFWKTPFGVRLPGVILAHVGLLPWLPILKKLKFSDRGIMWWLLFMVLGPLTGLGSFISTPDLPLMIFWGLSVWALLEMQWLPLGLFFGLGLLSKYMMILFLPVILVWLWWTGKLKSLKTWQPWAALVLSVIIFSPVIIWNMQNDFGSMGFQLHHGLSGATLNLKWPLEYLAGQFGLINPIIFSMAVIAGFKFYKKQKLLVVLALTPLTFFFITAFRSHVEPNWPVCAYPAVAALAVCLLEEKRKSKSYQVWARASLFVSALFLGVVVTHAIYPWLPLNADKDHTKILRQWTQDLPELQSYHPLYARSYQLAAYYSYFRAADREVFKPAGMDRKDFYDFQPQPLSLAPNYIVLQRDDVAPEAFQQKYRLKELQVLPSGLVLYQILSR